MDANQQYLEDVNREGYHQRKPVRATYRWSSAYDWLYQKMDEETGPARLRSMLRVLAGKLDSDTIENIFREEMSEDGYFDPLITWRCVTCTGMNAHSVEETDTPTCTRCGAGYEWDDLAEYQDLVLEGAKDVREED